MRQTLTKSEKHPMTHTTRLDVCVCELDENKQKEQSTETIHSYFPVQAKRGFPVDDINQTKMKTVSRSS
jgi:hypothetical protein